MTSEGITISLEEFAKYFLKRWKLVALFIILCTGLFCGAVKVLGEEISVPHSEEYLYYEQEAAWLEKYLEDAVLMQMNPTAIPEITIYLEDSSDVQLLKDYIHSNEVWDDFESERNKRYFNELIKWNEGDSVSISLRHVTEEECKVAADYLVGKLQEQDEQLKATVGALRTVTDEDLQNEQLRWYDRIEYSKSLLLEAEAGYTIRVNVIAAAATGVATGGVVAVVVLLAMYMIERKRK